MKLVVCSNNSIRNQVVKMATEPLLKENETLLNNLMKILNNPTTLKIFSDYMKSQMAEGLLLLNAFTS